MEGTVVEFSDASGLGVVQSTGGSRHPFHCTQIADGSRTIAVGTRVQFSIIPRLGRYEAVAVTPG